MPEEKLSAFAPGSSFICSYPRSGNTWTINLLTKALAGNPIIDPRSKTPFPGKLIQDAHYVLDIKSAQEQPYWSGVWKSHDLAVATKGKVIYVFRSPADVLASYLHLHRLQKYDGWDAATGQAVLTCYFDELIQHWNTALRIKRETPDQILMKSYESVHQDLVG